MTDRSRLGGVRVLLVDDAPDVRDVVTDILEQDGAEVTAAETAEKALEILRRERPNVLLSDLTMPGKGGYWLIGQVRALPLEQGGATPAAAFTAYSSPAHRAGVLRAGFQFHVAKPVGIQELVDVVATLAGTQTPRGVDAASSMR
jgi:CheY-like chemotaxis protein